MRHFHKAGLGLAAGIGLTLGAAATALADEPQAPCDCGEQKERPGDAAAPGEQRGATTPPEGIAPGRRGAATEPGQQGGALRGKPAPWAQKERAEGETPYQLGPLTGQGGPAWSPQIAGLKEASAEGPRAAPMGSPLPGWTPIPQGVPAMPAPAFGAGLGAPGSFGIAPLGGNLGAWSPATGIGPRAYGDIVGR